MSYGGEELETKKKKKKNTHYRNSKCISAFEMRVNWGSRQVIFFALVFFGGFCFCFASIVLSERREEEVIKLKK